MDSVNKEVIQVRNSILGFVVNLQISRQISSIGMSCSSLLIHLSLVLEIWHDFLLYKFKHQDPSTKANDVPPTLVQEQQYFLENTPTLPL